MEIAIDTLKIYERLKAANLNEEAAKEIAEVMREVSLESQKRLVIKSDLLQVKTEIEGKLDKLESKIIERITAMEEELKLIKWMLGILLAGVISLILKAFFMP